MTSDRGRADVLATDREHIVEKGRAMWESFRDARIFITGGTGFFGSWMLEGLTAANEALQLGARAIVLTRDAAAFRAKAPHLCGGAIELFEGDMTALHCVPGQFTHVIHAAVNYAEPLALFTSVVNDTRETLQFAVKRGAKRYLLTSSGAVYGRQPPETERVPETHLGAPDPLALASAYGEGKRAAEFLCSAFHSEHGLETVIARGFAFVGPYLPLHLGSAVGNFIRDALGGDAVKIGGDGTPLRSYLYGSDLTVWLWTMLAKGTPARAYNVGGDAAVSIRDLAQIVVDIVNPAVTVQLARAPVAGRAAERYVPSIERARQELGLESWIGLREGVERTARWHRDRTK